MGARIFGFIILIPWICGASAPSRALADAVPTTTLVSGAELLADANPDSTAMVVFQGRELFEVGPVGILSAPERAVQLSSVREEPCFN